MIRLPPVADPAALLAPMAGRAAARSVFCLLHVKQPDRNPPGGGRVAGSPSRLGLLVPARRGACAGGDQSARPEQCARSQSARSRFHPVCPVGGPPCSLPALHPASPCTCARRGRGPHAPRLPHRPDPTNRHTAAPIPAPHAPLGADIMKSWSRPRYIWPAGPPGRGVVVARSLGPGSADIRLSRAAPPAGRGSLALAPVPITDEFS
jgi:hypothetical protein